ncbi:hypothetical protein [Aliarcobacter lanthieri]|uniref:hypothetical protein n=1 Tax=Aliarcobacter lanthieri TaxID=1355374 RepID=UPI0004792555|nr:hypothetical protein [Aliarcobacter lanthieri]QKF59137.1 hypothetical protein ALANTH_1027 [Aliarcobacter lanthieri]
MKRFKVLLIFMFCIIIYSNLGANGYPNITVIDKISENKPKFNSLAEEEAYNKQEKEREKLKAQESNSIIEETKKEINQYYKDRIDFFKSFLVKKNESKESIDKKYQNSEKIVNEIKQNYAKLIEKANKYNIGKHYSQQDRNSTKNRELYEALNDYIVGLPMNFIHNLNIDVFTTIYYQEYLKEQYETFDYRDKIRKEEELRLIEKEKSKIKYQKLAEEQKKKAEEEKIQKQIELENKNKKIELERKKVQKVCADWLEKSHKEVYSLGVGELILSVRNGQIGKEFQIYNVEKNTFLVGNPSTSRDNFYIYKSDSIPYNSIENAPSEYCYK